MRIALFHNLLSGGAKRTLVEATRRMVARHQVDAYTLSCSEHEFGDIRGMVSKHDVTPFEPLQLLRSPFGRLNQLLRSADLHRVKRVYREIAARIDGGGYDVVLVHPCKFEQSPSLLRYLRTPSVYYCHEPRRVLYETMPARPYDDESIGRRRLLNQLDPLPGLYFRLLRGVDAANTRSASAVLVNSQFTAETVARVFGIRAHVSYHGVDVEQFQPGAPGPRRRMVLSVGSLTPLKGFDFLIRAMAHYPGPARPPLVIASNFQNPPERAYLERLAGELGVELELHGNVGDRELVELYQQASVVAYAPIREPFGLVPLEAMACATPVVGVREGGIPESVVDGETGTLVARDAEMFGVALGRLIEDPALARRYGENGRAHVLKAWTWDVAVASLERRLIQAVESRSGSGSAVPLLAR